MFDFLKLLVYKKTTIFKSKIYTFLFSDYSNRFSFRVRCNPWSVERNQLIVRSGSWGIVFYRSWNVKNVVWIGKTLKWNLDCLKLSQLIWSVTQEFLHEIPVGLLWNYFTRKIISLPSSITSFAYTNSILSPFFCNVRKL